MPEMRCTQANHRLTEDDPCLPSGTSSGQVLGALRRFGASTGVPSHVDKAPKRLIRANTTQLGNDVPTPGVSADCQTAFETSERCPCRGSSTKQAQAPEPSSTTTIEGEDAPNQSWRNSACTRHSNSRAVGQLAAGACISAPVCCI